MAQTGYTPILIYASGTTGNTPSAANLTSSASGAELALNYFDGKLFYKDASGNVQVLAGKGGTGVVAGSNTQIQFNNNGVFGAAAGLTWDGTYLTANSIKDSALTNGRVTYAGASGLLQDSANLTFDGTTLTANALTVSNAVTLSGGTANGVAYLNGSKVVTTGSALTFDGTNLGIGRAATVGLDLYTASPQIRVQGTGTSSDLRINAAYGGAALSAIGTTGDNDVMFFRWNTEIMRYTATGLGIGTSSPSKKLDVQGATASGQYVSTTGTNVAFHNYQNTGGSVLVGQEGSAGSALFLGTAAYSAVIGHSGAYPLSFATNNTERMRLDASGNLGLGVTPSANWGGSNNLKALQISTAGGFSALDAGATNRQTLVSSNVANSGGGSKYIVSDYATLYAQGAAGQHFWFTAPSGTAGTAISFTQAMTLDASGNLLVGNTSQLLFTTKELNVNAASGSAGFALATAGSARLYMTGSSTDGNITTKGAIPLLFGTNETERARIDSAGNFGLGVTPSAWGGPFASGTMEFRNGSGLYAYGGAVQFGVSNNAYFNGSNWIYKNSAAALKYELTGAFGTHAWYTAPSGTAGNAISFTQAMTLDASGNLLVGTTNSGGTPSQGFNLLANSASSFSVGHASGSLSGSYYEIYAYNGGVIGSITQTGTTGVLYNITSDQRLKENIQDADSASALIDSLQVRKYDWKADGSHQRYGFVAQELVTVAPEAVHQPADPEEMMAVDYSKLVPMLVKEIQSLRARVAQLESNP